MTPRRILLVLLALAVGFGVVLAWPSESMGPEEQVRRRIVQMAAAAEEKDLGAVMEGVSDSFRSDEGWGKRELKQVIAAQVLRGQYLKLFTDVRRLSAVSEDEVSGEVNLYFARSEVARVEDLARESVMSAWRIEVTFRKEGHEWRAVSAKHRRLEAMELF